MILSLATRQIRRPTRSFLRYLSGIDPSKTQIERNPNPQPKPAKETLLFGNGKSLLPSLCGLATAGFAESSNWWRGPSQLGNFVFPKLRLP